MADRPPATKFITCHCRNKRYCDQTNHTCVVDLETGGRCFVTKHIPTNHNKSKNIGANIGKKIFHVDPEERGCSTGFGCALHKPGDGHFCCRTNFCNEIGRTNSTSTTITTGNDTMIVVESEPTTSISAATNHNWGIYAVIGVALFVITAIAAIVIWMHRKRRSVLDAAAVDDCRGHGDGDCGAEEATCSSGHAGGTTSIRMRTMGMDIKLGEIIGSGTFGTVYKGTYLRDPVAVKVFQGRRVDIFEKEKNIYMKAICASAHPNILGYVGCDTINSELWLITEFCPLGSLHRYLDSNEVENVFACLAMCRDVVSGLTYLHKDIRMLDGVRLSVAHRDIKPSNIFLRPGSSGVNNHSNIQCVIGDFGCAVVNKPELLFSTNQQSGQKSKKNKGTVQPQEDPTGQQFSGDPLTQKMMVGTTRYMAPEVLSNEISPFNFEGLKCTDIYSLALVMWEIAYRTKIGNIDAEYYELPYFEHVQIRDVPLDVMKRIVCECKRRPQFPAWWEHNTEMTKLRQLIEECWSGDPSRRPGALNVKSRLDNIADGLLAKNNNTTPA